MNVTLFRTDRIYLVQRFIIFTHNMKNLFFSLAFAAIVVASMGTMAQTISGSGSASASVGVAPAPITILPPVFDNDQSNDDIVQLNNLRIQSISGTQFPVIINASSDFGVRCLRYQSERSASGIAFPCPVPPTILYQIRVEEDTIFLLRNRRRAAISDFVVGDRINVYGFMDRSTQTIDALIVRDLDKPQVRQYIQLNNMEVVSGPSSNTLPADITVVQKIASPCLDYGMYGTGGMPVPCPLGLEARGGAMMSAAPDGKSQLYYPYQRRYLIHIDRSTRIISWDRSQTLSLADITPGDNVNIYGEYNQSEGAVRALIIRDLSKPQQLGFLQVTVADGSIMCMRPYAKSGGEVPPGASATTMAEIQAPCGILYNATVRLYSDQGTQWTRSTEKGTAIFENLQSGQYTIMAEVPGYDSHKEAVTMQAGNLNMVGIVLTHTGQSRESSTTIYPSTSVSGSGSVTPY